MAGETVDEVVLAAVGLVGDDDDVASVRKHGVAVALLGGHELLDRREDDATAGDAELLAQVGTVGGLDGILAQQVAAAGEGAEELFVQVVSVGDDDDGRVLHRRIEDQPPGVESHAQALARTLRVPDDTDAPVAGLAAGLPARLVPTARATRAPSPSRPKRLVDREVDGMELVIARHLLGQDAAAHVLEDDEVADQIQEPALVKNAFQDHLQLRHPLWRIAAPIDRAPGLEPLLARAKDADPRLRAVRDDERAVVVEERRDLRLVCPELVERRPDRGLLVSRVLQLDHAERQPVEKDHDVRPPVVPLRPDHRELVDGQPVVVVRILEVDHARLRAPDGLPRPVVFNGHAVHEHLVDGPIALDQRRAVRPNDLAEGIVEGFLRQVRVQPDECFAQAPLQDYVAVCGVGALGAGLAYGDLGAVRDREATTRQPCESGMLNDGFSY